MTNLNLGNNKISSAGAAALAGARWSALTHLSLWGCGIDDHGAMALAEAQWPALVQFDLWDNRISSRAATALYGVGWPALEVGPLHIHVHTTFTMLKCSRRSDHYSHNIFP